MAVTTNLYPPIVDTYMPAFLIKDNSDDIISTTVGYSVTTYSNQLAYDAAVDQYIYNSDVDGVQELWDEYETKLAAIKAQYPDEDDPIRIELERQLKVEYDGKLLALISGSSMKDKTENIFFAEKPDPVQVWKTTTYNTVETNDDKYICRVYFSLSMYNDIEQIQNAQVTVRNQATNKTVLNSTKYPCEIMLKKINYDEYRETSDKYYIEIKPEDLEGNNFEIDAFYKVQIRFTSISASDPGIDLDNDKAIQPIDEWLTMNLNNFSEWSTVCLIRGISEPTLNLKDFTEGGLTEIYDSIINTQIIGELTFADPNESETLKYYRIKAYDTEDTLLLDSGDIYSNAFTDINNFNYAMKYWFRAEHTYYFTLTYVTSNLYTETKTYYFSVLPALQIDLKLRIKPYMDEDNGRIGMRVVRAKTLNDRYSGQIVIRRASSKDNYNIWDDVYTMTYNEARDIDFTWFDYTIENGVFYWYGVQGVTPDGLRTEMTLFEEPICCSFDDIFLTSGDRQLKIKFNPGVSSFQRTLQEAKVETIGSKYPYVKRNGYVNYIQFPLSGLVASAMDEDGLFTTKDEVYQGNTKLYDEYNQAKEIKPYNDFIWERFFREKVSDFLYDDGVKLYRSPSEGNVLIRLMNVQFQPNQTLGRRLWSFSSNAFEIDECNWDNYDKYGVMSVKGGDASSSGETPIDPTISPIQRVVFIDDVSEFPTEGKEHVLYIYENQIYLWDSDNLLYKVISVPLWNDNPTQIISASQRSKELYSDQKDLYLWDNKDRVFNKISVSENNTPIEDPIEGE